MRFARPWASSSLRFCSNVAGAPVTAALWISPRENFTSAVSLAIDESGIEMRTVPLNCQRLSSKSTPVVTARSAVMRICPCVMVTAPYSTTPFWLSKFRELAVSWIGSCSRSCAPAATEAQAASTTAAASLWSKPAIDVRFQAQGAGAKVGAHADRAHALPAEAELARRARVGDLGHRVEREPRRVQLGDARHFAGLAGEADVALELDGATAGRHMRLVRGQVPEP